MSAPGYDRCGSCGEEWSDHSGIVATCAELSRLKREQEAPCGWCAQPLGHHHVTTLCHGHMRYLSALNEIRAVLESDSSDYARLHAVRAVVSASLQGAPV